MNIAETFNTSIYQRPKTLLIFFSLLLFAHIVFTFCGFYGNDDIIYSKYAAIIAYGSRLNSNTTDHYSLRWMCILVTALFYKLFGINAFSSALFSFSCFIATAVLVFKLIRSEAFLIQLLTLILFFFNYTVIFYAHRLLPDAGVCLFVFVAYYCYHKQRFYSSTVKNGIAFGASIFFAALTKETIFITLPLWIFLFVTDMLHKRNYAFWLWGIAVLSTLTFAYILYFKITTDDWLYRYHLLQRVNALYADGTGKLSFADTLKRIGYTLWQSFLLNGDMQYLIPAITGIFYLKQVYKNETIKHIAACFFILLLSADMMTFSSTIYAPLAPDPRHFIFIIPFAMITAAYMLNAYMQQPQKYFLLLLAYIVADVFLFASNIGNTKYIYILITVVLLLRWLHAVYVKMQKSKLFYSFFAAIMFVNFAFGFIVPQYSFYFDQKEIIQTFFRNTTHPVNVYTGDPQTAKMGEYFLEFKNKNVQFKNLASCDEFKTNAASYLLINGDYDAYFENKTDSLMHTNFASNFKELQKINNSALYEVKNNEALNILKSFSTNDYRWR